MKDKPITGDEIRALREYYSLTQGQVAQMLHKTINAVAHWENGRRTMDTALMELLLIKAKRRMK